GDPRRSLASRLCLLQRERLHRADRPRRRGARPQVVAAVPSFSPSKAEAVRAMFTRIARRYDLMNSLMTGGRHHAWRGRVAAAATEAPAGPALDLATGTADLAIALRLRNPGRLIIGGDFSARMLQVARR